MRAIFWVLGVKKRIKGWKNGFLTPAILENAVLKFLFNSIKFRIFVAKKRGIGGCCAVKKWQWYVPIQALIEAPDLAEFAQGGCAGLLSWSVCCSISCNGLRRLPCVRVSDSVSVLSAAQLTWKLDVSPVMPKKKPLQCCNGFCNQSLLYRPSDTSQWVILSA